MSYRELPVTIAVERADGRVEHVRVGTATPEGSGFRLRLNEMRIGTAEASGAGYSTQAPDAPAFRSTPPPRRGGSWSGGGAPVVFPNYGRAKGAPIKGAALEELEYYANGARRSLADPSKERFHDKERALLAAIEAEIEGRDTQTTRSRPRGPADPPPDYSPRPSGPSYRDAPPDDDDPPLPTDDDEPFF